MKRRAFKLALAAALSFGVYKGAQAVIAPAPKPLTKIFTEAASAPAAAPREFRPSSLAVPEGAGEVWRIRLGAWEMAAGGYHTFMEFAPYCENGAACPDKGEMYQIQGIAMDETRKTFALLEFENPDAYTRYFGGDYVLKAFGVNHDHNRLFFHKEPAAYVDVFYGSKDEVLKMYLDALKVTEQINRDDGGYRLLDHNSNSVQRTLLDALGIEVPGLYTPWKLNALGDRIWTPGMDLSLLPDSWDRQKTRDLGGYGSLSGADLEKAARAASTGAESVWTPPKPPASRPPGGPA